MWVCLRTLKDGLSLLRHYVDGLDKQDRLLRVQPEACGHAHAVVRDLQNHFRSKNQKDRYDYNTIIISLYGYFERYLEDLITEYLTLVSSYVPKFSDLPSCIQEKHLVLSLDLARKADQQRFASTVRVEEIVSRLHGCFNTPEKYQLNVQAFTQHTANFRQAVVASTFNQCGIPNLGQSVRKAEPFISFLKQEDPDRDVDNYLSGGDDVVFARLDDLANRRNDVAHGTPVDDILSQDLLRSYIDFIEAYAAGVALIVFERALPFMLDHALALGLPILVFNGRIVCVNVPKGRIAIGDTLIAKTQYTSRPYKVASLKKFNETTSRC